MFSFDDILEMGVSPIDLLHQIEAQMNIDDIAYHMYNVLNDFGMEIPKEVEEHYDNHCN